MVNTTDLNGLGDALMRRLSASESQINDAYNKALKKTAIKTFGEIIRMTPVDTGRARNNWQIGMSLNTSVLGAGNKGLSYVQREIPDRLPGRKVYLFNNLPYIGTLEYGGYPTPVRRGSWDRRTQSYVIKSINGYSKQAPNGMVRVALAHWNSRLRANFAREIRGIR